MKIKRKIQTDFVHFPRPGENDPYVFVQLTNILDIDRWVRPIPQREVQLAQMILLKAFSIEISSN